MKTVVVIFLATLLYAEDPKKSENLYSWQIQFSNFDKCQMFYQEYEAELLNGLLDHSKQKYKARMDIDYVSCALVEMDMTMKDPKVIGQKVMYKKETQ
jgi:hypothetical protein|tara:strand:- start:685 stop:978 length:294 start_codon:yes stop_codon:yes gene_type:complete